MFEFSFHLTVRLIANEDWLIEQTECLLIKKTTIPFLPTRGMVIQERSLRLIGLQFFGDDDAVHPTIDQGLLVYDIDNQEFQCHVSYNTFKEIDYEICVKSFLENNWKIQENI
jgi:hypothetical protein